MPDKDTLTLSLRLHDPAEEKDAGLSTAWAMIPVAREDLKLPAEDFVAKYITPNMSKLELKPLGRRRVNPLQKQS